MIHNRLISIFVLCAMISFSTLSNAQVTQPEQKDVVTATLVQQDDILPPMTQSESQVIAHPNANISQWTTGSVIPVQKRYHTIASVNGDVFIFAGEYLQNNQMYYDNKCYKYNVASNAWTQLANFPITSFDLGTAQTINGKIYITAGIANTNPQQFTISLGTYEYDPASNVFTKKKSIPTPQCEASSGVIDGKLYVIGGMTIANNQLQYTNMVQIYDPATDSWGTTTNYPRAVRYLSSTIVQNKIVACGGYNNSFTPSFYISDTYIGELISGALQWRKVKDFPIGPSLFMSSVAIGAKAYFIAGQNLLYGNPPVSAMNCSYDIASDTWTFLEWKPTPINFVSQAGTDGNVVVIPGGVMNGVGYPLNVVEIFNPTIAPIAAAKILFPFADVLTSTIYRHIKKGSNSSAFFSMINTGTADLNWTASIDPPSANYLSISPTTGNIKSTIDSSVFLLTINSQNLSSGNYSASIKISSNDPNRSMITIPITLIITDDIQSTPRKVLMEEFTGTWCPWCPYGIDIINQMLQSNPTNLTVLEYHNPQQAGGVEPMQTTIGNQITGLLQVSVFPSATFDRTPLPYKDMQGLPTGRGNFKTAYALRATDPSPAGIKIKNYSYNASTKQVAFDADITFYQGTNLPVRLNIVITEDGFNYQQRYTPDGSTTQLLYPYTHNHVVRQVIPDAFGDIINANANNVAPLAVVTKHYSFTSLDSAAKNAHLVVIAHISDGTIFGQVLQSTQVDLTGSGSAVHDNGIPQEFSLTNYPNPVGSLLHPNTTITFALPTTTHVTLEVFDALGRNVATLIDAEREPGVHYTNFDASKLAAGIYYYTIKTGSFTQTKKLLVVK